MARSLYVYDSASPPSCARSRAELVSRIAFALEAAPMSVLVSLDRQLAHAAPTVLDTPLASYALASRAIAHAPVEQVWCAAVDSRLRVLDTRVMSVGTLACSMFDVPSILRFVLSCDTALGFVVAHNHPSGDVEPSTEDIQATRALVQGARAVSLQLQDHVVCAAGAFTSMRARGMM